MSESETVDEEVRRSRLEDVRPIAGIGTLVFGKWDASESPAKIQGLHLTSTSQPWVFLIPVDDTPTHGLEKPSCLSLSDTSTNSCVQDLTLVRNKVQ